MPPRIRYLATCLALLFAACSQQVSPTTTSVNTPVVPTPIPAPTSTATLEAGTATESGTATPSPSPTTVSPVPTAVLTVDPVLEQRLSVIEERTAQIRGLSASAAKQRRVVTRAELKALLQRGEDKETGGANTTQTLLRFLGLIGPNDNLEALQKEQLNQLVLGLFDTKTGDLYIVTDASGFMALEEYTYAHEYTHALQQGAFDIHGAVQRLGDDTEASTAFTALVEGDAVITSGIYARRHLDLREISRQLSQMDAGSAAPFPRYLRESLQFPYDQGVQFVQYLHARGGYEAVNKAFLNPPSDTAHVLHPAKYLEGDVAQKVELPDIAAALGEGWSLLHTERFGEFDLMEYLRLRSSDVAAAQAAAGWDGDRFAFLQGPGGALLLVDLVRWENEGEAKEFFATYAEAFVMQGTGIQVSGSKAMGMAGGRYEYLSLQGSNTLMVLASQPSASERVVGLFPGF